MMAVLLFYVLGSSCRAGTILTTADFSVLPPGALADEIDVVYSAVDPITALSVALPTTVTGATVSETFADTVKVTFDPAMSGMVSWSFITASSGVVLESAALKGASGTDEGTLTVAVGPVPEPSAWLLISIGLVFLVVWSVPSIFAERKSESS
jgi:hypothetical protein